MLFNVQQCIIIEEKIPIDTFKIPRLLIKIKFINKKSEDKI